MIIGRVIGTIVSTVKDPKYKGYKLLVVQEMNIDGGYEKNSHISIDLIGAGLDEVVMVVSGAACRSSLETNDKGIDSLITAKIEKIVIGDKQIDL